jgi:hypothetical protein
MSVLRLIAVNGTIGRNVVTDRVSAVVAWLIDEDEGVNRIRV